MRRRLRDLEDVESLLELHSDEVTMWELSFLRSLEDWDGDFTDRQEETLENICGKYGL